MPVTAVQSVSCTPLKPKMSFGKSDIERFDDDYTENGRTEAQDFQAAAELTDKANKLIVKSGDIKSPIAVTASLALAAAASYAGGKKLTSFVDASCFKNGAGVNAEKWLKSFSNTLQGAVKKINPQGADSKVSSLRQFAGAAVQKLESGARSIYKKLAYAGLPAVSDKYTASQRASEAFSRTAGIGAAAVTLGKVCTQDSNGDGVADILQRSQNAYTKTKTSYGDAIEAAGVVSELINTLT